MRNIREVLRLKWRHKLSNRKIANSCSISHSTVREYLQRARQAGLSWPLGEDFDDGALEGLLFPPTSSVSAHGSRNARHGLYPHRAQAKVRNPSVALV